MMDIKLKTIQELLRKTQVNGWLIYDFKQSNTIACRVLNIDSTEHITRPFYYWIPSTGQPILLIHKIEKRILAHLPGQRMLYTTYQERSKQLKKIVQRSCVICMEVSPFNHIPYLSQVCFGVVDELRSFGLHIESSGNTIQRLFSTWSITQLEAHRHAFEVLKHTYQKAFLWIRKKLDAKQQIFESDVQQLIAENLSQCDLIFEGLPCCAVDANAANPHYHITGKGNSIRNDQLILIDLWGKDKHVKAPYADITVMAYTGTKVPVKMKKIFQIVHRAQKKGFELIVERKKQKKTISGAEVDQVCRREIEISGYGDFFIHRTGHNIDVELHGYGAHLDSYETFDERELIESTCFSIEPGIYIPGEFGVRLESDVFIHPNGFVEMTTGSQDDFFYI